MTQGRLAGLVVRAGQVFGDRRVVVGVALALVAVQLGFRSWALAGGWFLGEDLSSLADATGELSPDALVAVRRDHLGPLGVLLTWALAQSTPYDWALAAGLLVGLQALASLAALWFVLRLVGARWVALVPLGWYLFGVATLPAAMWWSAAVLQLPLQVAMFLALTAHLEYARTRRPWFAVLAGVGLLLGMASDVGVVYLWAPMMFLSLYFSEGRGWRGRLVDGLWRQRWAWVGYSALAAGYLTLYLRLNPLEPRVVADNGQLLRLLVRDSLVPVLFGGPWRWGPAEDGPLVPAEAPPPLMVASWVVLTLCVVLAWRRRRAVVWALVPVEAVVVMHATAIAYGRGDLPVEVLAHEVRYLAVMAPVVTLAVAVMVASLAPERGRQPAPVSGGRRPTTRASSVLRWGGAVVLAASMVAVLAGSVVSSLRYVAGWHDDFPSRVFVKNVVEQSATEQLRILDQEVPPAVFPPEPGAPERARPSWIFRPLGDRVAAVLEGNDLEVLDEEGLAVPADVRPLVSSPPAPPDGCGYRVGAAGVDLSLMPIPGAEPVPDLWWGSLGYLASADGRLGIAVGDELRSIPLRRGLHRYIWLGTGSPDVAARLVTLSDVELCVDNVSVGTLVALRREE